jgi:hypothetical protein
VIGRSAWDSCCDGSRYERTITYPPVAIGDNDVAALANLPQGNGRGSQGHLASYYRSWGDWKEDVHIDQALWDRINVDPAANWPGGGFDNSMFWIEEVYPVYFHRYDEINGTTVEEGEWEEVDEQTYLAHADDFGMAIETKALGQFADEAIEEAIPAGLNMVGNPQYGQWMSDGQGGQQWSWLEAYAFYHLLFGGNDRYYYSRAQYDNYNSWRRDRRRGEGVYGYYGSSRTNPAFGSYGARTQASPRFAASTFNQSGASARRFDASVRSAAQSARARGPGSRGGK